MEARCNDGAPYAYYIRPSPRAGDGANRWLFFFKGGGGCFDEEACAQRWLTNNSLMRARNDAFFPTKGNQGTAEGIYYREDDRNAVRDWNMVHVYYCSSDAFAGDISPPQSPLGLWFRGQANVNAMLAELLTGFDTAGEALELNALQDAEQVIIAGGSAGAGAARLHMDRMASAIKSANPDTVVYGLNDAAIQPPFEPGQFVDRVATQTFHGADGPGGADDDCLEAHADRLALCGDAMHLATGRGTAEFYGEDDDGHLGVAASSEVGGVDGLFVFMAQWDGKATTNSGVGGICVRTECGSDADCEEGDSCIVGVCLHPEPCLPEFCTPDDGLCWGSEHARGCVGETATIAHQCGADGDCEAGEVCQQGRCTEAVYLGCGDSSECEDNYLCINGLCTRPVEDPDDCIPGTLYDSGDSTCVAPVGCSPQLECGQGYSCLPIELTPMGAAFASGVRSQLSGLSDRGTGVFVPNSRTHTAARSEKYYALVGGNDTPSLAVEGTTFAEAFGAWLTDPDSYQEHIAPPSGLPIPLLASDALEIDVEQVSARTQGTGCQDDALFIALCPASAGCDGISSPDDALALISIGDDGVTARDGQVIADAEQVVATLAARPGCDVAAIEFAPGDHIVMRYQRSPDVEHEVKIGFPDRLRGRDLPLRVYVGFDGATWSNPALSRQASKRIR